MDFCLFLALIELLSYKKVKVDFWVECKESLIWVVFFLFWFSELSLMLLHSCYMLQLEWSKGQVFVDRIRSLLHQKQMPLNFGQDAAGLPRVVLTESGGSSAEVIFP